MSVAPLRSLKYCATDHAAHEFARLHALQLYRRNAIYTYIPKNACTTMRYTLALDNGTIDKPEEIDWIHTNNKTFSADLRSLALADYSFIILRCPYRRLVSVFLDRIAERGDHFGYYLAAYVGSHPTRQWVPKRAKLAMSRKLKRIKQDYGGLTFRQFIESLSLHPRVMDVTRHWKPQNEFYVYKEYDDVFSVENFGVAVEKISDRIGLMVQDTRQIATHSTFSLTKVEDRSFCDVPISELADMREAGFFPDYRSMYDDSLLMAMKKLYQRDIDLYVSHFGADNLLFPKEGL